MGESRDRWESVSGDIDRQGEILIGRHHLKLGTPSPAILAAVTVKV